MPRDAIHHQRSRTGNHAASLSTGKTYRRQQFGVPSEADEKFFVDARSSVCGTSATMGGMEDKFILLQRCHQSVGDVVAKIRGLRASSAAEESQDPGLACDAPEGQAHANSAAAAAK